MNTVFIEPTDVLFFRDAVPMSAGQGKGAGCRLPFPSTLHEAFRASLLRASGEVPSGKQVQGRPRSANRKRDWHASGHDGVTLIGTRAFRSLRTIGPLPWRKDTGLLLPVPLDVTSKGASIACLQLWRNPSVPAVQNPEAPANYAPLCLPLAVTPPDKNAQLHGWWNTVQMKDYLVGQMQDTAHGFKTIPTEVLWASEHRIGVEVNPSSFASKEGQLYAGAYLRSSQGTQFAAWTDLADPATAGTLEANARRGEREQLSTLDWLLLGGEFRIARLWHRQCDGQNIPDLLAALGKPPESITANGPCLLKWILVTPAIFAHGSLPGWCADTKKDRAGGLFPVGRVCLDLPGRTQLISWCLGKPHTVSGWDVLEGRAKPTMLAVPAGSVYYFLCENRATASALAKKLHWQPRSDFYGEKGCGYGLVSFDVQIHRTSADVWALAN